MILSEEDLNNLAKVEQPACGGCGGDGRGWGGGAYATKLYIRTFSDFKSKIHQLEKVPSSSLKLQCAWFHRETLKLKSSLTYFQECPGWRTKFMRY